MNKICLLLLLALTLVAIGCATEPSGSQEYVPGKGWVPTK